MGGTRRPLRRSAPRQRSLWQRACRTTDAGDVRRRSPTIWPCAAAQSYEAGTWIALHWDGWSLFNVHGSYMGRAHSFHPLHLGKVLHGSRSSATWASDGLPRHVHRCSTDRTANRASSLRMRLDGCDHGSWAPLACGSTRAELPERSSRCAERSGWASSCCIVGACAPVCGTAHGGASTLRARVLHACSGHLRCPWPYYVKNISIPKVLAPESHRKRRADARIATTAAK